jgi:hypothetical protein
VTNVWTRVNPNGNLSYHNGGSACVVQGKIYVLGGFDVTAGPSNNFDIFDPVSNAWTVPTTSGTFTPRGGLSAAVVNNKVYALGGVKCDVIFPGSDCIMNTNEVYEPVLSVGEKLSTFEAKLLPNPTPGIINIVEIPENVRSIAVLNILGQSLIEQNSPFPSNLPLDLSKYPKGLYFTRISAPNSVSFHKIVRE